MKFPEALPGRRKYAVHHLGRIMFGRPFVQLVRSAADPTHRMTHASPRSVPEALAEVFVSSRNGLERYIRSQVGDPEIAADILQDSLLRALRGADSLHSTDRLVPWLHRIIRHAIIDHYRRRDAAFRGRSAYEWEVETLVNPDELRLLCACIEDVLPTMNPGYADLIRRMDLAEEDSVRVADALSLSRDTLKVRHHRARRQLRERLETVCRTCSTHGCLDCSCRTA